MKNKLFIILCVAFMVTGYAVANDNLIMPTNLTTSSDSSRLAKNLVKAAMKKAVNETKSDSIQSDDIQSDGSSRGGEFILGYGPKIKSGTIGFGADMGKYAYFTFLGNLGFTDSNAMSFILGIGPKYRYANKNFMAFGSAYVYGGYSQFDYDTINSKGKKETKTKRDFGYGMAFDFKLGACVKTNSQGQRSYVSIGYLMTAGDFKFKKIGKYGIITLSFSKVF